MVILDSISATSGPGHHELPTTALQYNAASGSDGVLESSIIQESIRFVALARATTTKMRRTGADSATLCGTPDSYRMSGRDVVISCYP